MKIGDKVRITEGVYRGLIGTITSIEGGKIYVDNDYIDAKKVWYYFDNLEPISDHMTVDEERLLKNARATFDDSDNLITCMKDEELHFGVSKDNIWKDKTYEDGLKEGYKKGFNAGVKQTRDKVVDALFTVVKI